MRISLPADLEKFIIQLVDSGKYGSTDAAVEDALTRLRTDTLIEAVGPDRLRREVEEGMESARRGGWIDGESVFAELRKRNIGKGSDCKTIASHRRPRKTSTKSGRSSPAKAALTARKK